MPAKSPCRLFVILAQDADVGVVLRRGPSKWVQVVKWDTRRDTFEDGAWFHGRIYEDRCDVAPDGELFLYFAAKHSRHSSDDDYGYSWTAVSRPPWLFALALWPNQWGTYLGGGRFLGNRKVSIRTFSNEIPVHHLNHRPPRGLVIVGDRRTPLYSSAGQVEPADWSGTDRRGHIVYARGGKLFRRRPGHQDKELVDFNGRTPEPQPAPAWAQRWCRGAK